MINDLSLEQVNQLIDDKGTGLVFLYTPFCGTCHLSEKILTIAIELFADLPVGKVNINYMPNLAEKWRIESVPCLVFIDKGNIKEKILAFQSVPYIVEKIKTIF